MIKFKFEASIEFTACKHFLNIALEIVLLEMIFYARV